MRLKMTWLFSLVFLAITAWSLASVVEAESSAEETFSLPSLEVIESVLRSSFENVKRTNVSGVSSRKSGGKIQEATSYRHHGIHAANAESWKLECVWEAMSNAARSLQISPETIKSDALRKTAYSEFCRSLSRSSCGADFSQKTCDANEEYRSIDGTCNNLQNTRWGAAPQPFERYLQADYGNGVDSFRTSKQKKKPLPNPRQISRILSSSTQRNTPQVSLMLMQWGQFIDHDVTLTPEREHEEPVDGSKALSCCDEGHYSGSYSLNTDCVPINVADDTYFKQDNRQCIRFVRSMPTTKGCSFTPQEQINQNTAFVDGSQIYGSEEAVANSVRSKKRGLLNVTLHEGNGQPLPPRAGNGFEPHECPIPESNSKCFLAGDIRVDEMPGLLAMHTTFIRLHNIIAEELYRLNKRKWNDETLFQETRRIVSALIQQITYRDWLPHVLGPTLMADLDLGTGNQGYKDTYNTNVNPTIRNVFATAAFRFGHTLLTDFVKAAKEKDNQPLEGNFFNITLITEDETSPSSLLKGLSRCPASPIDGFVANTFTDKLFAIANDDGNFFGLDLVALNIQRGRDHGIPSYRKWRKYCGLNDVKTFKKLEKVMEKPLAKEFARIYNKMDDVDIFPAALSEYPIKDGLLGETLSCLLARQFAQIKHGDRFWYERQDQPKPFTPAQLSAIRSQGLASIMCRVSEHTTYGFQPDPFLVSDYPGNGVMDCSNYAFINLNPWKAKKGNKG